MTKACLLMLTALIILVTGCTSVKPLHLQHYSKNIIAAKDRKLFIEKEQVDFSNLKHELVRRLVTTTSPITLHIHKDLPRKLAEALFNKLEADGFTNVQIRVFTD